MIKPAFEVVDATAYHDWETVYRENVVGIYQLVFRRVGNRADAEDLAEEVLVNTFRSLRFPASVHEVRAYLVKTARTVLADHWRRHYAAPETVLDLSEVETPARLENGHNAAASERALRILSLLPERSRTVLELRFLRGYSLSEVAREIGVSVGNAKVIQFRALRRAAELGRDLQP